MLPAEHNTVINGLSLGDKCFWKTRPCGMNTLSLPDVILMWDHFCFREAFLAWVAGVLAIHSTARLQSCSNHPAHSKDKLTALGSFRLMLKWFNLQPQRKLNESLKDLKKWSHANVFPDDLSCSFTLHPLCRRCHSLLPKQLLKFLSSSEDT